MRIALKIFFIFAAFLFYISCSKDDPIKGKTEEEILKQHLNLPSIPYNYSKLALPSYFDDQFIKIQDNTPAGNPITDWGATLGRVLFHDKRLSINRTIACASCHRQEAGFTDTKQFSDGFNGGLSKRHSMSLINARYYINGRFFWDERAATLEEQVLMPVQDKVEMGMHLDTLVRRLTHTEFYPVLFKYAFGSTEINVDRISKALAQFVRSIVSYRSKYDEGFILTNNKLADFPNFNAEENLGKKIFFTNAIVNCSGCHLTNAFVLDNPRNNGLSSGNPDEGIFIHTGNANDIGKFKVSSLKSVALRERFMHDGSISSLDAVIEHYNSGIQPNPTLDKHLQDVNQDPVQMGLTASEKNALKAFLETLTDHKLAEDEKYASPF